MEIKSESAQARLSELLKKKGIGPEASKSLKEGEIEELKALFWDQEVSLTTKATMLTALFTLECNPPELKFIESIKNDPDKNLPKELVEMLFANTDHTFIHIIRKIIDNVDLTEDESKSGMKSFLDEAEADHLKAAFLEGERLKRETFIENKIFFESLWNESYRNEIQVPILIDIADAYDGCNRTRHFSLFIASVLASLGFPTILHGIDAVAPKEGVTSHQILRAAGKNPLKRVPEVIEDLVSRDSGWGYIDQSVFFPKLYSLKKMRKEMVKRPFLATFEKLLQPIIATGGNFIVTGYTHSHYRGELVNQLKEQNRCKKAIVLKGVEGSTQLSMSRETVVVNYDGVNITDATIHPEAFSLKSWPSSRDLSITAEISLSEGVDALQGKDGFALDNIIYTAAAILSLFQLLPIADAVEKIKNSIKSGRAYKHWLAGAN